MSSVPEPLRPRRPAPLELFYDLVFVFAVSKPSHHLPEHQDGRGARETAVLLVAVFGTWTCTGYEHPSQDASTVWALLFRITRTHRVSVTGWVRHGGAVRCLTEAFHTCQSS
ncbi:low temperature requirement protein A [Streptomyces sp. NRRL S-340]|uniref:low temperature requirement protein A n=1 Tax=Streptomyces sp. NRRL S-340 TaxID=1463901 RepID=UPI00055B4D53|nr:low temperature requirement protein A [Streptomyces sp. NRRL S-340]